MFVQVVLLLFLTAECYCGIIPFVYPAPMPIKAHFPMKAHSMMGMHMFYPHSHHGGGYGAGYGPGYGAGMGASMHNFYPMGGSYQYNQIGYNPNWRSFTQGGGQFSEFSDPMWNQPQYPWNWNTQSNWYPGPNTGSYWNNQDGVWNQQEHWGGGLNNIDNWNSQNTANSVIGMQSH